MLDVGGAPKVVNDGVIVALADPIGNAAAALIQ